MRRYFESQEYAKELESLDLGLIVAELGRYNAQYGLGSTLARGLLSGLESADDAEQPELSEAAELESRQAFLQRIEGTYGILLDKAGIGLEPAKGVGTLFTGAEQIDTSTLEVTLSDGKKFISYLSALDPERIAPSQVSGLKAVAKSLIERLLKQGEGNEGDPKITELMIGAKEVVESYRRLDPEGQKGLATAVGQLSALESAYMGEYLKHYLSMRRQGLLAEVGGQNFGPSRWHTDSTARLYQEYWKRALDTFAALKKNPQARDVCVDVLSNLIASANYANKDLKTARAEDDPGIQDKLKTLENVLRTLKRSIS